MFIFKFLLFVIGIGLTAFSLLMTAYSWEKRAEIVKDKEDQRVVVCFLAILWSISLASIALIAYIS